MLESIGLTLIAILVFIMIFIYMNLSKLRNKIYSAVQNLEIFIKKRWDLIPSFVKIVKSYPIYEEKTLKKLNLVNEKNYNDLKIEQKIEANNNISKVISKMIDINKKYPDLINNSDYIELTKNLKTIEEEIIKFEKEYNSATEEYNKKILSKPINIVAILFGFNEEKIFNKVK